MTQALPTVCTAPSLVQTACSTLIIWLSIQREDSRRLVLLPFFFFFFFFFPARQHRWSARQIDWWGLHGAVYCGRADNDTIAQVVKCTPVIVLHQADEITLFRWHPTCPCSVGGPGKMTCFVFLTSTDSPPPSSFYPFLPMMPFTTSGLRLVSQGLSPWQPARSAHRKTGSVFLRHPMLAGDSNTWSPPSTSTSFSL